MNKIINKRILLEKKYSNICLHHKVPLLEFGNRVLSVSPGNFYYHTGINAKGEDINKYKELSKKAHFGIRKDIEEEVNEIIKFTDTELKELYFFEIKNMFSKFDIDKINCYLLKNNLKTIRKNKFNRLQRLFRKWTMESTRCHYKINGAKKRLHYKYLKKEEAFLSLN